MPSAVVAAATCRHCTRGMRVRITGGVGLNSVPVWAIETVVGMYR